jgi:hypothetical protein
LFFSFFRENKKITLFLSLFFERDNSNQKITQMASSAVAAAAAAAADPMNAEEEEEEEDWEKEVFVRAPKRQRPSSPPPPPPSSPPPPPPPAARSRGNKRVPDTEAEATESELAPLSMSLHFPRHSSSAAAAAAAHGRRRPMDQPAPPPSALCVLGVDVGSEHLGYCLYDAMQQRVLDLGVISLRRGARGASTKHLIDSARDVIDTYGHVPSLKPLLVQAHRVFVEDQTFTNSSPHLAIQNVFQTVLGAARCGPVQASAVKRRFRYYFPLIDDEHRARVKHPEEAQRRANKRAAWVNGRQFVQDTDLRRRMQREPKRDDAYDAYWIARYGAERMLEEMYGAVFHHRSDHH